MVIYVILIWLKLLKCWDYADELTVLHQLIFYFFFVIITYLKIVSFMVKAYSFENHETTRHEM